MKLRKTLSTLLAAALMCGMLSVPAMALSPEKITGGTYYNTIDLSTALNEGTAVLGTYHSNEAARPVRIYTVQAGTTLTVTGDHYITVHPVTLLPDGTYEFKSLVGNSNDPALKDQSELWRSWTWYTGPADTVVNNRFSSIVLNNSHAGTWMLQGSDVILKVLPVQVADQGNTISVYQVTSRNGLNVRAGAGTNFAKVGFMTYGTRFEVVTATVANGWGQLTNGNWVWLGGAKFIQYKGSCGVIGRQQAVWTAANTYRIVANTLSIHDGPAAGHAVVGSVAKGTLVNITEYYGEDWGYLANGAGWINLGSNGNSANVQFAEIKYASNIGNEIIAPAGTHVQARLFVACADGIMPIRAYKTADSVVIGYLFNQADGSAVDLVAVDNDWGQLANGMGWIYLPGAGSVVAGDRIA